VINGNSYYIDVYKPGRWFQNDLIVIKEDILEPMSSIILRIKAVKRQKPEVRIRSVSLLSEQFFPEQQ
jgi:hypothetical protein